MSWKLIKASYEIRLLSYQRLPSRYFFLINLYPKQLFLIDQMNKQYKHSKIDWSLHTNRGIQDHNRTHRRPSLHVPLFQSMPARIWPSKNGQFPYLFCSREQLRQKRLSLLSLGRNRQLYFSLRLCVFFLFVLFHSTFVVFSLFARTRWWSLPAFYTRVGRLSTRCFGEM